MMKNERVELLRALQLDREGNWDRAHGIAQSVSSQNGSRVHAYLHRKEGDLANASYWYSRAGISVPDSSLDQEWQDLFDEFSAEG
jgi:hypothetical protein